MSTLVIRKKSLKTWEHYLNDKPLFISSKFFFNTPQGIKFQIVEEGKATLGAVSIENITLYDDSTGGSAETFATVTELSIRLEALNYTGHYRDGDIDVSSLISSDVGNILVIGADGNLYVPTGGGGGVNEFIELTDTPATYTGQGTKVVAVKADETGLEFVTGGGGATPTLQEVIDTGENVSVNSEERQLNLKYKFESNESSLTISSSYAGLQSILTDYPLEVILFIGRNEAKLTLDGELGTSSIIESLTGFKNSLSLEKPISTTGVTKIPAPINEAKVITKEFFDASFTAYNEGLFYVNGTLTITDPTPVANKGYIVYVLNGTATIGGTGYGVGSLVYRFYYSGAWVTKVFKDASQLVADSITDGVTTIAPSQNAVFDALAGKQDKGVRLTNATVSGSTNLDWSAYKVFEFTLTGATTLVDVNLPTGTATEVIEMVVTGSFTFDPPAYWEALPSNDTYDGAKRNHIVVTCINGTTSSEVVFYSLENLT